MVSGVGVLLLASVAGYWVLERAATHKGNLKRVGELLGGLIIVLSLIGVACRVFSLATGKAYCPVSGWSCPFSKKAPGSVPAAK